MRTAALALSSAAIIAAALAILMLTGALPNPTIIP